MHVHATNPIINTIQYLYSLCSFYRKQEVNIHENNFNEAKIVFEQT